MKTFYGISVFIIFSVTQVVYGGTLNVTTNKQVYSPGERIEISITASGFPSHLEFSSTCQVDYIMDGIYDSGSGIMCAQIPTSVTLPHTWTEIHSWSRYSPGIGGHFVTAYVYDIWGYYFTSNYASFSVVQPFHVISPNGGEQFIAGSTTTIQWYDYESGYLYDLTYSTDNGQTWLPVASSVSGHSCPWTVPSGINSNQCLVKVTKLTVPNIPDTSDNTFIIFECQNPILGDLNGDCYVNYPDFNIISKNWLRSDCAETNQWCDGSDTYQDGAVDIQDFMLFAEQWLACGNPFDPAC